MRDIALSLLKVPVVQRTAVVIGLRSVSLHCCVLLDRQKLQLLALKLPLVGLQIDRLLLSLAHQTIALL